MEWLLTRKLLREEGSQLYLFDIQPNQRLTLKPTISDEEIYSIAASHKKLPAQLLTEINWDFKDSVTQYLTHKFCFISCQNTLLNHIHRNIKRIPNITSLIYLKANMKHKSTSTHFTCCHCSEIVSRMY